VYDKQTGGQHPPCLSSSFDEMPATNSDCIAGLDDQVLIVACDEDSGSCRPTSKTTDRPARPCPFCGQFKVRLTRHIRSVHKEDES
jgi:hypothetical protein